MHKTTTPTARCSIMCALRYQMQRALGAVNLGRWAELMQASIPYLPHDTLPTLRLICRKAHTSDWCVHVPPPGFLKYISTPQSAHRYGVWRTDRSSPYSGTEETPHRCKSKYALCHLPQPAQHQRPGRLDYHSYPVLLHPAPNQVGHKKLVVRQVQVGGKWHPPWYQRT